MFKFRSMYNPIPIYVSDRWTVHKNRIFDVKFEDSETFSDDHQKFMFLETFFSESVFMSKFELISIKYKKNISTFIDVGYYPPAMKGGRFQCEFYVSWKNKSSKELNIIEKREENAESMQKVAEVVSKFMRHSEDIC